MALRDDVLYVGDHETGRIVAMSLDGEIIDWIELDLPSWSLGGLEFDEDGALLFVSTLDDEVLRIRVD